MGTRSYIVGQKFSKADNNFLLLQVNQSPMSETNIGNCFKALCKCTISDCRKAVGKLEMDLRFIL